MPLPWQFRQEISRFADSRTHRGREAAVRLRRLRDCDGPWQRCAGAAYPMMAKKRLFVVLK